MVKVSFRDKDPDLAAKVVNAVVHAYQDYFVEEIGLAPRKRASEFVQESIETTSAELAQVERELAALSDEQQTALSTSETEMGRTRLQSLDENLTQAKARQAQAEARLNAYLSSVPRAIDEVRANPQIQRYREQISNLQREMAELEGKVGEDWPRLKELRAALLETRQNLSQMEQQLYDESLASAEAELAVARQEASRFHALYSNERQAANRQQSESIGVEGKRREYEQKEAQLNRLLARREEVSLASDLHEVLRRQVVIVGTAEAPESPAVPRTKLNLLLGAIFGGFLGIGAAFLAEALDNKVRGGQHLADLSGLPLLGSIPRLEGPSKPRLAFSKKAKRPAATPVMAQRNHDVEEAFRALRSALLLSQTEHPPKTLLVTSALPGEGKSTIAANLGRTLASFGAKVVLIDADLRHPRLHRVFKAPKDKGLTNVLATSRPVQEVIAETPFKGLDLIPGGPCPPDPGTLLDRGRIQELARELSEDHGYDYVIIDTPPVLVFADCFNIVPCVEGAIFVARAMATQKDAVREAMEGLRKVHARMLGVVLNGEVSEERGGSYYRYYHYRRGYYQKAAEAREKKQQSAAEEDEAGRSRASGA